MSIRVFSKVLLLLVLVARPASAIIINEIHYAPRSSGPDLEFIELYNEASEAADLSGYSFTQGITFVFEYPTFIRGLGAIVVAADKDALLAAYPHLATEDPKFPKVVGNFLGRLDDAGERITLVNPGGGVEASVRYNNRGAWPAAPDKTGHSLILSDPTLDPDRPKNWSRSPLMGGSPGLANLGETLYDNTVLIEDGETWRYLKGLKAQETDPDPPSVPVEAWRALDFNDSAWLEGPTGIGIESNRPGLFATELTDMVGSYISVYFRKKFEVANKDGIDQLILKIGYDDGFAVYLNGVEVARKNLAVGAQAYTDRAAGNGETREGETREQFQLTTFIESALRVGTNVLAVQVHNQSLTSNDFGFLPTLLYRTERVVGTYPELPVTVNECLSNTTAGTPASRWLELFNAGNSPIDLSGYHLSDDPRILDKFTVPAGRVIAAGGFLAFGEDELAPAGISLVPGLDRASLWLGLSTPGLEQVVDAYAFDVPAAPDLSEARYPDGSRDVVVARMPTRGAANRFDVEGAVVINEIMYNPYYPLADQPQAGSIYTNAEDQGEYLELFNRGANPVSLRGWRLADAVDFAFPDNAVIGPGEYLVVAKDPDWVAAHYGLERARILGPFYNLRETDGGEIVADPAEGFLANAGEEIELLDELGNQADNVRYFDSGRWPIWGDGRGSSLELIDPRADNGEAAAWDASLESPKAEWRHFSYSGRYGGGEAELKLILLTQGIVLIDNFSVKDTTIPDAPNMVPFGGFEAPLAASDMLFGGTHAWSSRITTEAKDGTGCLRLVSTGRGNNRADRVEINTFNPRLPAGRNLLVEFDAKWVAGEGVLLIAGYNHSMAQSFFIPVPERNGTPGAENSVRRRLAGGNPGPILSDVQHVPALPPPTAPVTIRARASDPDGVGAVTVEWRLDGTPTYTTADLLDDGAHDDGAAGDGIYGGTIPGQDLNRIVVFRIVAVDASGNRARFPFDEAERTNPLRVDPANLLPASARTTPPGAHLAYQHTNYAADAVRSYRMVFQRENWTYLTQRPVMSNDLVEATFIYNDRQSYYNVGIRFGNSPWTRPGYSFSNASYRAKFGDDDLFQGWRKFKMDNQRNENLMDEKVAIYLFRSNAGRSPYASPPYLETFLCQPYVNNQRVAHIYDHVEVPGKPFLEKWFGDDSEGVLYKMDDRFEVDDQGNRAASIEGRVQFPPQGAGSGTNKEEYRWYFFHRTRDKFDDFSELMSLARLLDSRPGRTPNPEYLTRLFDEVNVEEMVRNWAVTINIDNWDTWGTERGKNCFIYRPRIDGRWQLMTWDEDLIFGSASRIPLIPGNHSEVARILSSPNGRRMYHNVMSGMLDTFWKREYVDNFFGEVIKVAPAGAVGSHLRGSAFVQTRANTMRGAVGTTPAAFAITSPAADEVAQIENVVTVQGTAPYGVWFMVMDLNGEATTLEVVKDINWQLTRWTTRPIQLVDGRNRLTFYGFGADGAELLGQDTVTITVGGGEFVRGDADVSGTFELTDALVILNHLFQDQVFTECIDRLDVNDSGRVDLTDALHLANYLFFEGPPPAPPFPEAGRDPTEDNLAACP